MYRSVSYLWAAACIMLLLNGCAGRHFHDVDIPLNDPPHYELDKLPANEYWTGVVFNGSKIGFTHFVITPSAKEKDLFEVRSQAFFHFRFLMMDKSVSLTSYDLVDRDLCLLRFTYEYEIDGNRLGLTGEVKEGKLKVVRSSRGVNTEDAIKAPARLYPGSVLYLYPLLKGLGVGEKYEYQIYDGESQCITGVSQEILAYQRSDLFSGEAFKMKTGYQGQEVTSWIDGKGLPLLETAMGGAFVSGLESEQEARRYLVESSLNKDESLLAFSLIKVARSIPDPPATTFLEVYIDGFPGDMTLPSGDRQEIERRGERIFCRVVSGVKEKSRNPQEEGALPGMYLKPSYTVPGNNVEIRTIAGQIVRAASTREEQIHALLKWIRENIEQEPVDAFTALDVLSRKKAECQGHAYLYAAFARSLGIPTRIANGIVYSSDFKGFLYHAWAESFVQGSWVAVDPTMSQMPADATHIKFVEGETMQSLVPIVNVMGKLRIEVLEAR